jgi:MFS family permease
VVIRTVVAIGFSTFLPVLLTRRGMSVAEAGLAAGAYLVAGSIGGLTGGPFADRFGPRRVSSAGMACIALGLLTDPTCTRP